MSTAGERPGIGERATATLGTGIVVVAVGFLVLAALELRMGDVAAIVGFAISTALLAALGASCLILLRRAERERRLVDAERELSRAAVEEHTMARRKAEQADAVNRQLMQILGKELRGPLATIRGFARELEDRGDELPPERREEFFAVIRRQSHRLLRVIEDLQLAAKLAAGEDGEPLEALAPVDVASLVRDTVDEIDPSPGHRVVVTCGPDLARVRGTAGELRQAILALVENAIRFSPAGGTVEVVALQAGPRVEIAVRDEGVGVPESRRDEIFELLERGNTHGGLGVGLFLVRNVAARCEGEVRFDSEEGRGSTFTLSLPAIPSDDGSLVLTPPPPTGTMNDQ